MIDRVQLTMIAHQLAAMRNQIDALMTLVEGEMQLPDAKAVNESPELEKKTRAYFGGQNESPAITPPG